MWLDAAILILEMDDFLEQLYQLFDKVIYVCLLPSSLIGTELASLPIRVSAVGLLM